MRRKYNGYIHVCGWFYVSVGTIYQYFLTRIILRGVTLSSYETNVIIISRKLFHVEISQRKIWIRQFLYACGSQTFAVSRAYRHERFEAETPMRGSRVWRGWYRYVGQVRCRCHSDVHIYVQTWWLPCTALLSRESAAIFSRCFCVSPGFSQMRTIRYQHAGCSCRVSARGAVREAASAEQDWRCGRINETLTMRAWASACRQNWAGHS